MNCSHHRKPRVDGRSRRHPESRTGAIGVLAAVLMVVVLGMTAFAIDMGYIATARSETQRTADATAHAAVIEFARSGDADLAADAARDFSSEFTAENPVLGSVASLDGSTDVRVGRYEFGSGQTDLTFGDPDTFNAVKVRVRRTREQNGAVRLFFGSVLDRDRQDVQSEAIAALIRNVAGFKIPPSGENVPLLPITVSQAYWENAFGDDGESGGTDVWSYDRETKTVNQGSDGIAELSIFPNHTGSSGNLGTVNIGVSENSTAIISRQIRQGLTQDELDYHGGTLEMDSSGTTNLSGNPGLSASLQNDLASLAGQVRVILIHDSVKGGGNTADFRIVRFQAVRIMSAHLSGGDKSVAVQPASLTYNGVIQGTINGQSRGLYSSPRIVD